ncbi:MAG: hypothetical protein DRO10_00050 [Thermoprotei archaeon]|nr:MAG: hypothetical protein DRO10_00050 [Thermoprotei archaeon]
MEDSLSSITRYLVIKRLSGDTVTILAIKEYLIDGASPSTIGHKYGISKFRVRGYVQRVMDKARNHMTAAAIVSRVFPYVINIEPIILKVGNRYVCLKCDQQLARSQVEHHIRRKHKELVNELVSHITASVRTQVR